MDSMNRQKFFIALIWTLSGSLAYSNEFGFPALNTVGRYLGVGWSHHTYHSQVDGRFNIITNRHSACQYPNRTLTNIYSPDYNNYPPRQLTNAVAPTFWTPNVIPQGMPTTLPESSILESNRKKGAEPKTNVEEIAPPEETIPAKPFDPPKPIEPPPRWLKPFLEEEKANKASGDLIELDRSPSDKTSNAPVNNRYRR